MQDIIYIVALCVSVVAMDILHRRERRDLYNRIMSRNATEYDRLTHNSADNKIHTAHRRNIDKWQGKDGD